MKVAMLERFEDRACRAFCRAQVAAGQAKRLLREERAQGTTEYAILVGVLVVIAITAIVALRGPIQSLWDAITKGFKDLNASGN
ncbi:hypothetical protein QUW40_07650 [Collinsella tanakaei]|uniref:Flp family type IVb pilin n=1 Tax=Collinsella tanakaei TaxID=626935 RepID=UPI0025A32427|nr:hypothetical protein [Collinsella tanakaei]MDM8246473.1 hypothetical protein [Collinsella tanakaei]